MLRPVQNTQDPDVEESRLELEAIEGRKTSAQAEVISIAEGGKELESSFADRKREIADELAIAEREAEIRKDQLKDEHAKLVKDNEQLDQKNRSLRTENASLVDANSNLDVSVKQKHAKKLTLESDVARLTSEKNALETAVTGLNSKHATLGADIDERKQGLAGLESQHHAASKRLDALKQDHAENVKVHGDFKESSSSERTALEASLAQLSTRIMEEENKFEKLTAKVAEFETTIAAYRAEFEKKDSEIKERMGNAARLELHVDGKLNALKEIEKQYTNEHLARFGYRKTD